MQERSHAFAMKSQLWLLDPRPNLPSIVRAVEAGFELSEASNTPVMLELRIRACHVYGSFVARDNKRAAFTPNDARNQPQRDTDRIVLPPASYLHEQEKIERRWPAAVRYIEENHLNEFLEGEATDLGIIVQGDNTTMRVLHTCGLADVFGNTGIPVYVLNVVCPLIESEIQRFCAGKKAVLLVEEGQPEFIEHSINSILRRLHVETRCEGKGMLPRAGEYTGNVVKAGLTKFLRQYRPDLVSAEATNPVATQAAEKVAPNIHGTTPVILHWLS